MMIDVLVLLIKYIDFSLKNYTYHNEMLEQLAVFLARFGIV